MNSEVRDISMAPSGEKKIDWVKKNMPLLRGIEERFAEEQPFHGLKVALSVHIEAKTAYLCRVMAAGGAEMSVTGCNPLSTQDDVAAALAAGGISVFAVHGATGQEYHRHLESVILPGPNIIIDDGGDLAELIHTEHPELLPGVIGGCEETTTGITRLRAMVREGRLKYPVLTVNDADCKHLFDNRYGTGQSVWDGINRTTNLIVAGKTVVVAGYGWCGRGVSMRAKGFGAKVIVTEINPVRALEAAMDGYEVMPMEKAAALGDIFVTVTGCLDIITEKDFRSMKDGAVLCNAGHFNVEVDVDWLERNADEIAEQKPNIMGYRLENRWLYVLAEGRLVNLASGDGHPAEIMDMSFAIQALGAEYLAQHGRELTGLVTVPQEIDDRVARLKLKALKIEIDTMSAEQIAYTQSWQL